MFTLSRACFFAFALLLLPLHVAAWNRGHVDRFAELPADAANPEGITGDRHGNIYVTTFDLMGSAPGRFFVYDRQAICSAMCASRARATCCSASPSDNRRAVRRRLRNKTVWRVDPFSGAAAPFTVIPGGAAAGPNASRHDRRAAVRRQRHGFQPQ